MNTQQNAILDFGHDFSENCSICLVFRGDNFIENVVFLLITEMYFSNRRQKNLDTKNHKSSTRQVLINDKRGEYKNLIQ